MKTLHIVVAVIAVAGLYYLTMVPPKPEPSVTEEAFTEEFLAYMREHGKSYNNHVEFRARYQNFVVAHEKILEHQSMNGASFNMAHNMFSDWTDEEYKAYMTLDLSLEDDTTEEAHFALTNPRESMPIDWRALGGVNEIQDQGQCGSCWAFSATFGMESAHFKATGNLAKFSESQLVDCDYGILSNHGCNGGLMNNAFKYYKKHDEVKESDYTYEAAKRTCQYSKVPHTDIEASAYKNVKSSVSQLKAALSTQGISIGVHAGQDAFRYYDSGIMTGCKGSSTSIDHGIGLVGWGIDATTQAEYWIIRNSWGTVWGEEGYAKVAVEGQACGLLLKASFPTTN